MDLGPALRQTHIGLLHQLTKIETAELHTHTKQDAPSFQKIIGSLADTQNLGNPKCAFLRFQPNGCFLSHGGTPKSSILIGLSIVNHPFWVSPSMETSKLESNTEFFLSFGWAVGNLSTVEGTITT